MKQTRRTFALRPTSGFSMIELLIVITVAGLLMAIALPKMAPMRESAGVRSSRQVVQTQLATARQTAMRRGGTARLIISGNTLSVSAAVDGDTTIVASPVDINEQYAATLTADVASIQYNSRGLARLVNPAKIKFVRNASADSVCVTILGMVGRCGL